MTIDTRASRLDPLYMLELSRALLAENHRAKASSDVIRACKIEIEWWQMRAVRAVQGKESS
jgi:hypothetical protein